MKLPLIQRIPIQDLNEESLKIIFKRNALGQIPTILVLDKALESKREEFTGKCIHILEEMGIDPSFPYPVYILSEKNLPLKGFPQIRDLKKPPQHFLKKIKKVKKREQALLAKADILQGRIVNHPVSEDVKFLKERRTLNYELRNLAKERAFYQDILEKYSKG